ncbi:MAG: hypothetical protein FJ288_11340 [Planctomycetes bacterium]|nr:hypothetical protein [Planctomycetota bacterium]
MRPGLVHLLAAATALAASVVATAIAAAGAAAQASAAAAPAAPPPAATAPAATAAPLPGWTAKIRRDHPRLFFNAETWPAVRARAEGAERAWYARIKQEVDRLPAKVKEQSGGPPDDLGPEAARAAFVFLMSGEPKYRDLARKCLDTSLRCYDLCYEQRKTVNWYSTSRVHAVMAWDWLYNDLAEAERADCMTRLVRAIDRVLKARPPIYRENTGGYATGFYGFKNAMWFIGCTAWGTGIEPEKVREWLVWGRDENLRLLEHRRKACGDDGGGASSTLGYVFGAYPWSEQNFFYTWLSAAGENIAPDWPHSAWLANYVLWNTIAADPAPLEFGYGDTPHQHNRLPISQLYTHMANIRHLYGRKAPEAAALARYVQDALPQSARSYSGSWFIYPFLLGDLEQSPAALAPEDLPAARHFETMGQIFMRSGVGKEDTYAMFSCGGMLSQHRHYDALNFVIYHRGFLALDSGTRYDEFSNGQHLANYFAQTVAHNCVLVHQPGEPPAPYWGGKVEANHGGQHQQLGSAVKAFLAAKDYVYAAGDATACYHHRQPAGADRQLPRKCELVTRQLVFILPRHFVMFDRVVATDPGYRKEWLLHTAEEPSISGNTFRADQGQGRLYGRTLLPEDAALAAVGGPGKEFWAAGRNWDLVPPGPRPEERALMGRWRLEVTPGTPRKEDFFLHVIQVGDRKSAAVDRAELIRDGNHRGVRLVTDGGTWEVTFAASGDLAGRVKRTGGAGPIDAPLAATVQPQSGIMASGRGK